MFSTSNFNQQLVYTMLGIMYILKVTMQAPVHTTPNFVLESHSCIYTLKTCRATRNPEFPRTGPDRTETGPGNILKNIFGSGRGILFRVGPGRGILFRVGPGRGIFLQGYETFSPGISGINLPFIPKLRK